MHFSELLSLQLFTTQVIDGIDAILSDESMGGSQDAGSCHGLVLVFHLKLQMNSTERLLHMLQDNNGTLVANVHGIKYLQPLIEVGKATQLVVRVSL